MRLDRRGFGVALAVAVGGVLAGGALSGCDSMPWSKSSSTAGEKHACKGLNNCKGQGGCGSSDNKCNGKNSCKGKGGCATCKHDCGAKNDCKGQGGCKTGDNKCAGKNSCKGKGGCASPVKH